jgi:Mycotoxin biosynthesis protein UstYa
MSESSYERTQYSSVPTGDIESEGKYSNDSYSDNVTLYRGVLKAGYFQQLRDYHEKITLMSKAHIIIVLFILSWSLTAALSGYLIYQSTRTGPSNPVFPQVLYCKSSRGSLPRATKFKTTLLISPAPAQHLLKYESKVFKSGFGGDIDPRYHGAPSPELDANWDDLYNCELFLIHSHILEAAG